MRIANPVLADMQFFSERLGSFSLDASGRRSFAPSRETELLDRAVGILSGVSGEQIEWLLAELDQAFDDWRRGEHQVLPEDVLETEAPAGETFEEVLAFVEALVGNGVDAGAGRYFLMPEECYSPSLALVSLALALPFLGHDRSDVKAAAGKPVDRMACHDRSAGILARHAMARADALRIAAHH